MASGMQDRVKVFNKDFVEANIDLEAKEDKKGKAKELIYISEDNKSEPTPFYRTLR